ncbi:uncharacterized protein LAESUDRAFT_383573 [Laetiporus sulphureus 93-53]|uniref:Uncharacterized protein n=1 Tax=Laetiporus sulphureus 93-53 TaxID=1314785 RepID=A0A165CMC2_9APHY|nr:uncharacterized protein LAESUDRAFT_383573 [Laetiporus sulphureus 93-53]KZT03068.1 hypothetical protein LAESUDRAFT_383573 [Laetiporus sulphureus 93-53]
MCRITERVSAISTLSAHTFTFSLQLASENSGSSSTANPRSHPPFSEFHLHSSPTSASIISSSTCVTPSRPLCVCLNTPSTCLLDFDAPLANSAPVPASISSCWNNVSPHQTPLERATHQSSYLPIRPLNQVRIKTSRFLPSLVNACSDLLVLQCRNHLGCLSWLWRAGRDEGRLFLCASSFVHGIF